MLVGEMHESLTVRVEVTVAVGKLVGPGEELVRVDTKLSVPAVGERTDVPRADTSVASSGVLDVNVVSVTCAVSSSGK